MRNIHLLVGNLTRTACGHSVWSIYPHESEALDLGGVGR